MGRIRAGRVALAWLIVGAGVSVPGLRAQEEKPKPPEGDTKTEAIPAVADSTAARDTVPRAPGKCVLVFEPTTANTRSLSLRDILGLHVTHVGGGMQWTCGTATMEADSAIKYDRERRVDLFGNVRYRDSIRTLEADSLTYDQIGDLIVADGNVHLTRPESGSTLSGPRVEFLRAVSGKDERTIARQRPHMTLYDREHKDHPPFEVDADQAVFAGEEAAHAWGDVEIHRPDLEAVADSAFFDLQGGTGLLFGSPRVKGESFELSGDTIRIRFEEGALRQVYALGNGEALGESYEVRAENISVEVKDEVVDGVWAYGPGRSLAISDPYRLYGDSLRFVMRKGQIDTVIAVGRASAVEDSTGLRALEAAPPDTTVGEPVSGMATPPDTTVAETGVGVEAAPPDTTAGEPAQPVSGMSAPPDSAAAPGDGRMSGPPSPERIPAPVLRTDRAINWVTGDTLFAIFQPGRVEAQGASADSARSQLERLRVIGNARSFYAIVRDSAKSLVPSRNYMIGRQVEVLFKNGRADRVIGRDAIGLYLDPAEAAPLPAPSSSPDSARALRTNAPRGRTGAGQERPR